jgi:hypothetical protein
VAHAAARGLRSAQGRRIPAAVPCLAHKLEYCCPSAGESGAKEVWEVPKGNGEKVFVEWGAEFDNFDPVTQARAFAVSS